MTRYMKSNQINFFLFEVRLTLNYKSMGSFSVPRNRDKLHILEPEWGGSVVEVALLWSWLLSATKKDEYMSSPIIDVTHFYICSLESDILKN